MAHTTKWLIGSLVVDVMLGPCVYYYLWNPTFLALLSSVSFILRSRPHISGFSPHVAATDIPKCLVLTLLVIEEVYLILNGSRESPSTLVGLT